MVSDKFVLYFLKRGLRHFVCASPYTISELKITQKNTDKKKKLDFKSDPYPWLPSLSL